MDNKKTEPLDVEHRDTGNLAFAGFVHMKGLKVIKAREWRSKNSKALEFMFTFQDPDNNWEELHMEFANSEARNFDQSVRALKRLCKRSAAQDI